MDNNKIKAEYWIATARSNRVTYIAMNTKKQFSKGKTLKFKHKIFAIRAITEYLASDDARFEHYCVVAVYCDIVEKGV